MLSHPAPEACWVGRGDFLSALFTFFLQQTHNASLQVAEGLLSLMGVPCGYTRLSVPAGTGGGDSVISPYSWDPQGLGTVPQIYCWEDPPILSVRASAPVTITAGTRLPFLHRNTALSPLCQPPGLSAPLSAPTRGDSSQHFCVCFLCPSWPNGNSFSEKRGDDSGPAQT